MDKIHDILHSIINHIIPHEGNDYRPHLLQRSAMVMMLILVLLSFLAANFQALLWQSSDWLVGAVLPAVVVDLTNNERADLSLSVLTRNPVLDAAATLKAQDMAKYSYFSHDSPTGVTPWFWFKEAGYPFVNAGENLAVYFSDSSEVVKAWMNSPTHRANMTGTQYREIGVGTATGTYKGFETVFVVQFFGTRGIPVIPSAVVSVAPVVPKVVEAPLAVATPQRNAVVLATSDISVQPLALVAGDTTNTPEAVVEMTPEASLPATARSPYPTRTAEPVAVEPIVTSNVVEATATPPTAFAEDARVVMGAAEAVSLYSGMAASSSNLLAAPYDATVDLDTVSAPKAAVLATEPSRMLQLIYLVLGTITAFVLLLSVMLEWRHHRPVQTAYGLVMLLIMAGLFYVHSTIIAGAVIL